MLHQLGFTSSSGFTSPINQSFLGIPATSKELETKRFAFADLLLYSYQKIELKNRFEALTNMVCAIEF